MALENLFGDSRIIVISDTINHNTVKEVIQRIQEINLVDQQLDEVRKKYDPQPIMMIINSFGGSVYDGWALIGAMEMSFTPIYTVAMGSAMSMAFAILLAGHERYAHRYSTLMYHEVSGGHIGKLTERIEDTDELIRLQKQYDEFVLSKTKLLKKDLDAVKKGKREWYITPDEAKKLGIIDEVLPPKE